MSDSVRLNVHINTACADALQEIRERYDVSATEVVRRALSLYKFLEDERQSGVRIVLEGDDRRELVWLS